MNEKTVVCPEWRCNRTYGYDLADRLIHETDNAGPSRWSYDLNGNRTSSQPGTASYAYDYAATSNRLQSVAGPNPKTYTYDVAGNVIGDGTFTYTYDKLGRLVSVWQGSVKKAAYSLNALGQRTSKFVGGVVTLFFYDEAGHLLGEYDGNRALIQETVWLGDLPVAVLKKNALGQTEVYRIHADHLNTPRAILDSQNRIVWKWHSNAFGQGQPDEDPDGDGTLFVYNLRFPGQYFDKETLRHYNYYRSAYNPATGRYEEADPIGLAGGWNLYAYVGGNPLTYIDPLGLAYFGVRPLQGLPWLGPLSNNPLDNATNTAIAHEQLFFEDGKAPENMGFFSDSKRKTESQLDGYRRLPGQYNDCVMRLAARAADTGKYSLPTNNCQSWADRVREQYNKLIQSGAAAAACGL